MEDAIDALHGAVEGCTIQDRSFNELVLQTFEILAMAGAEVVDDYHIRFALEVLNNMRANETRTTGNKDTHGS